MLRNLNYKSNNIRVLYNHSLPCWVKVPNKIVRKKHIINALNKYWPLEKEIKNIENLKIEMITFKKISLPPEMIPIKMPKFAYGLGENNYFYVPRDALNLDKNHKLDWKYIDWWLVIFLLLESSYERAWEYQFGSIDSYRWKLRNWNDIIWDYAWVNRIAIFIRYWSLNKTIHSNDGYQIKKSIRMTHDLDALEKTTPIVLKQSALLVFNFIKAFLYGEYKVANKKLIQLYKFLFLSDDWNTILELIEREEFLKLKPLINVHARKRFRGPFTWLMDPSYKINDKNVFSILKFIQKNGWEIGLHPSYFSYENSKNIMIEKIRLERILSVKINSIRQHWLKFSWEKTWRAQSQAGLRNDCTLMFNDKSGFRNSAALCFSSYYSPKTHYSISTSFMDSHDFQNLENIFKEIIKIKGDTYILWHPHTITNTYGWKFAWERCLQFMED